ncbi:MAG: lamin tail domain-containing protein [Bacteroidetes bacterium]|nr:lamin tail domain-containing protein [Bacteroidota bacterium]
MRICYLLLLLFNPGWLSAQRYDVVIQEIFADPSPPVGLPSSEWIELRNQSRAPVLLSGWRLSDLSSQSAPFPNVTLLPDSILIVCPSSALSSLSAFGRCLGITGFPSLDNGGETILLKNAGEQIIHALEYSVDWHTTELKKAGGWSLEMIDPDHPGSFQINWGSATHPAGGTPGKTNSIDRTWIDLDPHQMNNAYAIDSTRLLILLDEALDSAAIEQPALYELSDERRITEARCLPPLFDRIELRTDWPLKKEKIYTLHCRQLKDLRGNQTIGKVTTRIGLPSEPDTADICLNELLFDPPTGGTDYVELLNIGKKIIDLSKLYLSARTPTGILANINPIKDKPRYFFPQDYLVLTSDSKALERHYFVQQPGWVIHTEALPSLPDASGNLVILNGQGKEVEEINYSADWHFPLLRSKTGVALERIDPKGKTQD